MKKLVSLFIVLSLCVGLSASLVACGGGKSSGFKVGVILIGDRNEGYSYAHIQGIEAAMEALDIEESQVIWKYGVTEDEACEDAARDLAEQGCDIIFANSFNFEDYVMAVAEDYPDIIFCHATGTQAATSGLANLHNYFTYVYESRYISGVVAGLKLQEMIDDEIITAEEAKIGYVGAFPFAEVISGFTSFFLGVRSIVPEATMKVLYTNSWFDPTAEKEAAKTLIENHDCVVISQHADSNGAPAEVQAQSENGKHVYSVGYNVSMLDVAPDVALTSAQNNWGVYYTYAIDKAMKKEAIDTDWAAGYAEDAVMVSELGTACAEGTAAYIQTVINQLKAGTLHVFDTSTWTVDGATLTEYVIDLTNDFQTNSPDDENAIWGGYFHESELRSAPSFDIIIDGVTVLID
ncbi:MAG: BMP family ABC transporter substrate-binding protein [Eubacteriales bacterium]